MLINYYKSLTYVRPNILWVAISLVGRTLFYHCNKFVLHRILFFLNWQKNKGSIYSTCNIRKKKKKKSKLENIQGCILYLRSFRHEDNNMLKQCYVHFIYIWLNLNLFYIIHFINPIWLLKNVIVSYCKHFHHILKWL